MQRRRVITIAVATAAVAFGLSAGQASSAGLVLRAANQLTQLAGLGGVTARGCNA